MYTQQQMNRLIPQQLAQIEKENNIRILFAAEAGSRASGTATDASDFDIRFLYLRCREDYLRLDPPEESLKFPLEEGWDLVGWDLKKAMAQIHKGNPQLYEILLSPVVYRDDGFSRRLLALMEPRFAPWAAAQHYRGRLRTPMKHIPRDEVFDVKHWLYAVQFTLDTLWILDRRTPPPVNYRKLMDAMLPREFVPEVERLLRLKADPRSEPSPQPNRSLWAWLKEQNLILPQRIDQMPRDNQQDWDGLNQFFLEELRR